MQKSTIILFISFILFSVKGFGQGEFKDYQEAENGFGPISKIRSIIPISVPIG